MVDSVDACTPHTRDQAECPDRGFLPMSSSPHRVSFRALTFFPNLSSYVLRISPKRFGVTFRGIEFPYPYIMADDAADQESEAFSLATFSDPSKPRARPPSHDPDPEELSAAATEIVSEPVCKRCFKLGNDVWNPDILEQRDYTILAPRSSPVEDVAMSAREGCPGCEIIAWALEPYVQQVQEDGGQVIVSFGHTTKWMNDRFIYYGKLLSQPKNRHRIELVIKKTPFRSIESSPARSSSMCNFEGVPDRMLQSC